MTPSLEQLIHALIEPLRNRIANAIARVVLSNVDNGPRMQRLQVDAPEGLVEDVEHMQPYGLSTVPVVGAEAAMLCVGGDRAVPIAVVVSEPATRPTGQEPGEVAIYHRDGHVIHLRQNGDIEIQCRPGQRVYVNDGSGGAPLATLSDLQQVRNELDGHEHTYIQSGPGTPTKTTLGPSVTAPTGTQVLRAK